MKRNRKQLVRRAACLLTLGTLFQGGGCTVDSAALTQGILGSVLNAVVGGYVCDNLGVPDAVCLQTGTGL